VVRSPDGMIAIDPTGRAPGRGAYLCHDAACFATAGRRHALERALGGPLPPAVVDALATGLGAATSPDPNHRAAAMSGGATIELLEGGAHGQE
jgi:predicted RNA-binding protein YlxR (DUF448 family)